MTCDGTQASGLLLLLLHPEPAVEQVCQWVGSLEGHLKDYRDVFEEEGVDGSVLLALNDARLEKLGIDKVVSSSPSMCVQCSTFRHVSRAEHLT